MLGSAVRKIKRNIMYIVTGGFGFIGSNLARELIVNHKKQVLIVDYVKRNYLDDLNYTFLDAHTFYSNLKEYCFATDMIFHEGAISSTTETNISKLLEYNINPSLNLIYYCRDYNIPLQYASSASVYGQLSKDLWDLSIKPINPLNEYAKTKYQIDYVSNLVINSKKSPKLLQGMRYFNVYGPNENHKKDQASPYHKFSEELQLTGKIKLFENSDKIYRDFISVDKLIEIKLQAIKMNVSGAFDVGTGIPTSFYNVALDICNKFKVDPKNVIEYIPMPDKLKYHYQMFTKAGTKWITTYTSTSI
jgi:ADP-L-glycero-D-manno-heptose 6-epimerase